MCKYCEGLKINPESFNGEQEPLYEDQNVILQVAQDTPIGRRTGSSSLDILVGSEVKHLQIYYCPMCGRKLNYTSEARVEKEERKIDVEVGRTTGDWEQACGGSLSAIKYFFDRLNNLDKDKLDEVRKEMRYVGDSRLKFVKDMYDSGRLSELDEKLKEKEGKI